MTRFGGGPETPEEHAHFGTIDVLTGYCACVALGAALERRRRTGQGGVARASLAAAGALIQAQFMYDYPARAPFCEASGRETRGEGPFYQCYEASDGWMFFAAPSREARASADVAELRGLSTSEALAEAFSRQPMAYWMKALNGSSATIVPLGSLHATQADSLQYESRGEIYIRQATFRTVRHDQHPMGRWVDLVAPNAVRPTTAIIGIPGPAPKYGQHTRKTLSRLGYDVT